MVIYLWVPLKNKNLSQSMAVSRTKTNPVTGVGGGARGGGLCHGGDTSHKIAAGQSDGVEWTIEHGEGLHHTGATPGLVCLPLVGGVKKEDARGNYQDTETPCVGWPWYRSRE